MTPFEKVIKIAKKMNLPYAPDIYKGQEEQYITYNYVTETAVFGDNKAEDVVESIQVHFFLPLSENYTTKKKQIRDELVNEGFTFPEITILNEEKIRHIVFECDVEQEE